MHSRSGPMNALAVIKIRTVLPVHNYRLSLICYIRVKESHKSMPIGRDLYSLYVGSKNQTILCALYMFSQVISKAHFTACINQVELSDVKYLLPCVCY